MGIKLIIADDAPFIIEVVRHVASASGIDLVGEARNGQEAVQVALEKRPDVILMDIVMPVKSGIDAAKEILQEWPEAKIIACSTLDQDSMVNKAIEAGCCHYLEKPFKAEQLVSLLKEVATLK